MKQIDASIYRGFTIDAYQNKGSLLVPILMRSEIEVDASNFHYWKLCKLLPTIPDGKRAELSIIDIIWIEVLKSMKNLGCPRHSMSLVHQILFEESYHKNHAEKNMRRNLEKFERIELLRPLNNEEVTYRENTLNTIKDPILRSHMRWSISHLFTLVLECIELGSDINIHLYENGKVGINGHKSLLEIEEEENVSVSIGSCYVNISLTGIVNRFFNNLNIEKKLVETGYLSPDEVKVVSEMRNENIKTLTIHFDNEAHSIKKIECDTVGYITGDKAIEVMKILGMKNYSSIEVNTRDGKNLSFIRTEKKIL
ncbi:MAG: hypothetical protein WCP61_09670 [Chitinophagia bacterium]